MGIERQGQGDLETTRTAKLLLSFAINVQYFEVDVGSRQCFHKMTEVMVHCIQMSKIQ